MLSSQLRASGQDIYLKRQMQEHECACYVCTVRYMSIHTPTTAAGSGEHAYQGHFSLEQKRVKERGGLRFLPYSEISEIVRNSISCILQCSLLTERPGTKTTFLEYRFMHQFYNPCCYNTWFIFCVQDFTNARRGAFKVYVFICSRTAVTHSVQRLATCSTTQRLEFESLSRIFTSP